MGLGLGERVWVRVLVHLDGKLRLKSRVTLEGEA